MDLQRYDVIKAKIKYEGGSVQAKERPYVIIGNSFGTRNSDIIIVMPLTSKIKKLGMPVHCCIDAGEDTGLSLYSMVLGEQPQTISKNEVIDKLGSITDQNEKDMINKVCFNTFFFGEDINWKEVLA